jgi:hypothetical protein
MLMRRHHHKATERLTVAGEEAGVVGCAPIPGIRGTTIGRLKSTHSRPSAFALGTALHTP